MFQTKVLTYRTYKKKNHQQMVKSELTDSYYKLHTFSNLNIKFYIKTSAVVGSRVLFFSDNLWSELRSVIS